MYLIISTTPSVGRLVFVVVSLVLLTLPSLPARSVEQWEVKDFVIYEGAPPGSVAASLQAGVAALFEPLPDPVRIEIEQFLGEVADILEAEGWKEPYLRPIVTNSEGRPAFQVYYYSSDHEFPAARQSDDCKRAIPRFIINARLFLVNGRIPPKGYQDLAHEVFHGVQARYPLFVQNCEDGPGGFISEGTAQAVGADVATESTRNINFPHRTAGSWAAHRWGLRAYDYSLLVSQPRSIIYGASSFWRYLGEHAASSGGAGTAARTPDYTYLQKFFNSEMTQPVTDTARMTWLNEQVTDKDKLIKQRLSRLYPNFVTTFAAYGGTRINPSRSDTNTDAETNARDNRRRWLDNVFLRYRCPELEMSDVQDSPAFEGLTLDRYTAACVQLQWNRAQARDLQVRVFHHDRAMLRNITLGTKEGAVVVKPTLVKVTGEWSAVWMISVEPGDKPIEFIFTNMARTPTDTRKFSVVVEFSVPWWNSDLWQGPMPTPPSAGGQPSGQAAARPSGQTQNQRVAAETRNAMETLNSGLIGGSSVGRSPEAAPCADAFVDIACGPMTSISLELLPGGMFGSGWTSSGRGGTFGQFAGMMSGMAQIGQQDFNDQMKKAVDAQDSMDGAKISIRFPLIDYGFTGNFDNANIVVSARGGDTLRAIGPGDTQPGPGRRYPLSGRVSIEKFTPWEMSGTYSGSLVNVDRLNLVGDDPSLPIDKTVSGRFHIVAPWKDDDRAIVEPAEDPRESVEDDVEQMMSGLNPAAQQQIRDAMSGNSPSSGTASGAGLESACSCECSQRETADELCEFFCEEAYASCESP